MVESGSHVYVSVSQALFFSCPVSRVWIVLCAMHPAYKNAIKISSGCYDTTTPLGNLLESFNFEPELKKSLTPRSECTSLHVV